MQVGYPTLTRVNLQYISGRNPHLTNWFYKEELGLNSLLNMILETILTRFVGLLCQSSTNI